MTARTTAIAEVFGDNRVNPYWQTGLRFSVVPNLFQMDATIGKPFDSSSSARWISIGFRFTPDKMF
jgi:hypothetical protein